MKYIRLDTDYLSLLIHLQCAKDLWNKEQQTYHIDDSLWDQNILHNHDFSKEHSFVAYLDDTLVGFCFIKTWNQDYSIKQYNNRAWISLMYVAKKHRRKQIGSTLLQLVEESLSQTAIVDLSLGKDTYNFFAGLNDEFHESRFFFEHHDFKEEGTSYDFLRDFKQATKIPYSLPHEYKMKVATKDDFKAMNTFFETEFPGRWDYEFKQYVEQGNSGREFVIMTYNDKEVVAFCRTNDYQSKQRLYNINWIHNYKKLVGIGPLGVSFSHRKKGLGFAITARTVNLAIQKKATHSIIDWTSHVDFYTKFGYEITTEIKSYIKQLKG